jgi:uncharacterized protein (DUF488 family)
MSEPIRIFTIGFTKKSAEEFFTKLHEAGVKRLVDIRLNNTSQLAGFTKKEDLQYFLKNLVGIDYLHVPELAPTQEILDAFKKEKGAWSAYESRFLQLMKERRVEDTVRRELLHLGCLLCSEPTPENCHRRLAAEYLQGRWNNVEIAHLL